MSSDGERFLADLEAAIGKVAATTAEQRFLDAVDRSQMVHAHPDTVAIIEADGRWAEHFPGVRLVGCEHVERGVLLSGHALAAWDLGVEDVDVERANAAVDRLRAALRGEVA